MSKRPVQEVQNSPKGSKGSVKKRRTSIIPDHMALAGTCRQIRRAYTDDVWKALNSIGLVPASHIFSTAWLNSSGSQDLKASDDYDGSLQAEIAAAINRNMITTQDARSSYKVTENEILSIPFETRPNPHGRGAAPMKLFRLARVYALAMRVHGGPQGHKAHLKKLADKSTKAKATRVKNGTVPVKKSPPSRRTPAVIALPSIFALMANYHNYLYDGYDGYEDYEDYDY